jgi:hypothetical protein
MAGGHGRPNREEGRGPGLTASDDAAGAMFRLVRDEGQGGAVIPALAERHIDRSPRLAGRVGRAAGRRSGGLRRSVPDPDPNKFLILLRIGGMNERGEGD